MYLTVCSGLLLLLLAWHFSIQASAFDAARHHVQQWLHNIGATADSIEFRMLRGALTIHNIKTSAYGGQLKVEQVFIKGNPASIGSGKPLLHQVDIQGLSFDAKGLMSKWENINIDLPNSLQNIFLHAKSISLHDSNIQHIAGLPTLLINHIQVSGSGGTRQLLGYGMIGKAQNPWDIHYSANKREGAFSSIFQNINTIIHWSGMWNSKNVRIAIQQTHTHQRSSLNITLEQQQHQWRAVFKAKALPVSTADFQTQLTGSGSIEGTPKSWVLKSSALTLHDTIFKQSESTISVMSSKGIHVRSDSKRVDIKQLNIRKASFIFNTANSLNFDTNWHFNIANINVHDLNSELLVQQQPIKVPPLFGSAKIKHSDLQFDLSTQSKISDNNHQFLRLRSTMNDHIIITTTDIPLVQLRNLLPPPLQKTTTSVAGNTSLKLTINPSQNWSTTGEVVVSDLNLSSKSQTFRAKTLRLTIQQANNTGVDQAAISVDDWFMLFPLTPKQAWSEHSNLEHWARIPWSLETITFNHGAIALGNAETPWLSQAQLNIQHWQSNIPSTLQLKGQFGMVPMQVDMTLKSTQGQGMLWQSLKINTKHANLFSLSEWLELSGLPTVEKGHLSLNITAKRIEKNIQGYAKIALHQLETTPTQNHTIDSIQTLIQQRNLNLTFPFQGQGDWTKLLGHSWLVATNKQTSAQLLKKHAKSTDKILLGSLRLHQGQPLSHNERVRLRNMIKVTKGKRKWHIELIPDLGTAKLTTKIRQQTQQTQIMIKNFLSPRGIKGKKIYIVSTHTKHRSTGSAAAIHVYLVP